MKKKIKRGLQVVSSAKPKRDVLNQTESWEEMSWRTLSLFHCPNLIPRKSFHSLLVRCQVT